MNELQIFSNDQFGQIRTTVDGGDPLFVAADVCKALDIGNPAQAVSRLDEDEKAVIISNDTAGRPNHFLSVTESGLYSLVLGSRKPEAKAFKRWITHEVIPTIRKTGGYVNDDASFVSTYLPNADEQTKALFRQTLATVRGLNSKIEADKPKVLFADAVSTSDTVILIGELAKLIKQNGVDIGQNRLFQYLRDNGYLIKRMGADYNSPTQYSMERGWFKIKERTVQEPNGAVTIHKTTLVTGKGQQYFIHLFLHDIPWNL